MITDYLNKPVLIIDDDVFILKVTKAILEKLGFEQVATTEFAYDVINILENANPPIQLVLLDLNMPNIDGLELLRKLAEIAFQGDIILFSGEDKHTVQMAENLAKAHNLSVLGFIIKPINQNQLKCLFEKEKRGNKLSNEEYNLKITKQQLKNAIEKNEIIPWFQPKININTYEPTGVEVLARWFSADHGTIPPNIFIPLAEKYGLINLLTDSIIYQAALVSAKWKKQNVTLKLAINLSMDCLYDVNFPERLNAIISKAHAKISQFHFEVTESQLLGGIAQPLEILLRLRMNKVQLSVDDFGTGSSNLHQLQNLPFDELKLDKSYVAAKSDDHRAAVILKSTVDLAKTLQLSLVAEGVETLKEWHKVKKLGCDQVQGYLIAKPMPEEQVLKWLRNWPNQCKRLFGNLE